jgi:copper homeostasis protein
MSQRIVIEICLDSVESAIAAEAGGADRIELCADLAQGGVTPSAGLIEEVRAGVKTRLHTMVRPRAGDFEYSSEELRVMERDIEFAKRTGVDGIVVGTLNPDKTVNVAALRALIEAARPMSVTFHRAFDLVPDPGLEMDVLLELGVDRLLTSGQAPTAVKGHRTISDLVQRAQGRLVILAGGGVSKMNARWLIEETGIVEIHAGSSVSTSAGEGARRFVVAEEVRALRTAAETKRA